MRVSDDEAAPDIEVEMKAPQGTMSEIQSMKSAHARPS